MFTWIRDSSLRLSVFDYLNRSTLCSTSLWRLGRRHLQDLTIFHFGNTWFVHLSTGNTSNHMANLTPGSCPHFQGCVTYTDFKGAGLRGDSLPLRATLASAKKVFVRCFIAHISGMKSQDVSIEIDVTFFKSVALCKEFTVRCSPTGSVERHHNKPERRYYPRSFADNLKS